MNKILFKLHSWLALFAFVPLLVISVTGSILVFKHEIDSLLMPDKVRVAEIKQERQSLDSMLASINALYPGYQPSGWAIFADRGRADLVYVIARGTSNWSYLLIDQYSGNILAEPQGTTHYLTDWLLDLHYAFLLDDVGLLITSIYSVVLFVLAITGFWLYRKFWKAFFTLRWNSRLVVYFSDLHKMVGIPASPIFLILAFTGAFWNITHLLHEWQEHAEEEEHYIVQQPLYNIELSLQEMHDATVQHIRDFKPRYLSMPFEPGRNFTFYGDVATNNILLSQYASTVAFDIQTGEFLQKADIRDASVGMQTYDSFRRLHFGDFAGILSRVIWCIAGLTPVLLSITGVTIWYLRREKRQAKKARLRSRVQN